MSLILGCSQNQENPTVQKTSGLLFDAQINETVAISTADPIWKSYIKDQSFSQLSSSFNMKLFSNLSLLTFKNNDLKCIVIPITTTELGNVQAFAFLKPDGSIQTRVFSTQTTIESLQNLKNGVTKNIEYSFKVLDQSGNIIESMTIPTTSNQTARTEGCISKSAQEIASNDAGTILCLVFSLQCAVGILLHCYVFV